MLKSPSLPVRFSDLCRKEVINTCDGCRLGHITDLEIDTLCGRINCIFIPKPHKPFSKCQYHIIRWEQVERIGADTVLVRLPKPPLKNDC